MDYEDLGEVLFIYFKVYFHTKVFTFHLGIKVNTVKTEIQHMGRVHKDFNAVIKNQSLKLTVSFVYQGGNLSSKEGSISDVKR